MRNGILSVVLVFSAATLLQAAERVPAGARIVVSLNESISSNNARVGQRISGSVAQNVTAGGKLLIPRGSPVILSVASARASGRLSTPAKLWLRINSITVRGKAYPFATRLAGRNGPSHRNRNIAAIGGTSAAGAVIGAIAGGGKGAAIGAAAGAGAGTAGAAATGKRDIHFPVETRLRFTTKSAVTLQ